MSITSELERLLSTLGAAVAGDLEALERPEGGQPEKRTNAPRDAIDRVLGAPDRATAVASLRESEAVEAFRNELVDGLIRVDTANRLLRLVNEIIMRLL